MAQQSGEDSLSLDALLVLKHVAIHKAVQHSGVGMNINVELQTDSLMEEKRKRTEGQGNRQVIKKHQVSRDTFLSASNTPHQRFSTGSKESPLSALGILRRREAFTHGMTTKPSRHRKYADT